MTSLLYDISIPEAATDEDVSRQIPDPVGYSMLIALPNLMEKTEAGIVIPADRVRAEKDAAIVGYVLKQGPDCYKDPKRFNGGPWCKVGDWILMRSYGGTRISLHGEEFRLINDDSIEAVVEDPSGIARVSRA